MKQSRNLKKKIEETSKKYNSFVINNVQLNNSELLVLFRDASEILNILIDTESKKKEIIAYKNMKAIFTEYWKNYLDPIVNANFSGFNNEQNSIIDGIRRELMKSIYSAKVYLLS